VSWIPLSLLVVSSPLSVIFLIGFYSEGLFHALLASGACERHTGSLVHEHVLRPSSSKSSSSCFVPHVLNDERFLNSLLSVGLLPSTSTHLFWKRDLESYEYLEACSHQWQVLSPSTVGNTSMSPDRWILQVFDLNTFIHTCKNVLGALIPTFIIGRLSHVC
jgi:hypothetical protein